MIRQFFNDWFKSTMTMNTEYQMDECPDWVDESRGIGRSSSERGLQLTLAGLAGNLIQKNASAGFQGGAVYMNHSTDIEFVVMMIAREHLPFALE